MNTHEREPLEPIAAAIMTHLEAHPLAADSAAGVARWWLGALGRAVQVDEVEAALELLVARQALRRLRLIDGTALYSQALPTRQ